MVKSTYTFPRLRHGKMRILNTIASNLVVTLIFVGFLASNTDAVLDATCRRSRGCTSTLGLRLLSLLLLLQVLGHLYLVRTTLRTKDDYKRIAPTLQHRLPLSATSTTEWKYCPPCCLYAPPRSHHCPVCDTCVLKRDHHCFLLGVCIGYHNQRHFVVFLNWVTFSALTACQAMYAYLTSRGVVVFGLDFYRLLPPFSFVDYYYDGWGTFFIIQLFLLSAFSAIFTAQAMIQQVVLIALGCTTHEVYALDFSYSRGIFRNFRSTFGDWGIFLFCLPLPFLSYIGDGLTFRREITG